MAIEMSTAVWAVSWRAGVSGVIFFHRLRTRRNAGIIFLTFGTLTLLRHIMEAIHDHVLVKRRAIHI
jgi:hypothetical protein